MTINGEEVVGAILWLVIIGAVYWLLTWLLAKINPDEPIKKVAEVILVVGVVLLCINVLLTLAGHPVIKWK